MKNIKPMLFGVLMIGYNLRGALDNLAYGRWIWMSVNLFFVIALGALFVLSYREYMRNA